MAASSCYCIHHPEPFLETESFLNSPDSWNSRKASLGEFRFFWQPPFCHTCKITSKLQDKLQSHLKPPNQSNLSTQTQDTETACFVVVEQIFNTSLIPEYSDIMCYCYQFELTSLLPFTSFPVWQSSTTVFRNREPKIFVCSLVTFSVVI